MKIKYSRHARRRMQLYKISEEVIIDLLQQVSGQGRQEIIKSISGFKYPLKIIYEIKKDQLVIITAYPLRKGTS